MLQGTLDTLSLPELFSVLASTEKSGALHVRGARGLGVVYFEQGRVCAAEAGVQSGPVEDEGALRARLNDVCFELFRYESGNFEFEPGGPPRWPVLGDVDVDTLVLEADKRLAEWKDIEAVVPSVECRPWLVADAPGAQIVLDRSQWRMVTAIAGRRRVSAIMRLLESSEFEVCRTLKSLVEVGLIEVELPAAGSELADAADMPESSDLADVGGEEVTRAAKPRRNGRRETATNGRSAAEAPEAPDEVAGAAAELRELAEAEVVDEGPGDTEDPEFKEALVKFLSSVRDA